MFYKKRVIIRTKSGLFLHSKIYLLHDKKKIIKELIMQIMHYSRILLSLLLFITGICPAMQKPPADMLVGAAAANNIKGLNYWIKTQKVQPTVIDSHGHTPLGRAATNGQYQALAYLVDAGAPINQKDADGLSPLAWAVIAQDPSKAQEYANIVQYLISKGADVNARDNKGITILHNAARGGNVGTIKMLLNHGANRDINAEGSQEKGRLQSARLCAHPRMRLFILIWKMMILQMLPH